MDNFNRATLYVVPSKEERSELYREFRVWKCIFECGGIFHYITYLLHNVKKLAIHCDWYENQCDAKEELLDVYVERVNKALDLIENCGNSISYGVKEELNDILNFELR